MRAAALAALAAAAGCASPGPHTVATDVQMLERPVPVYCRIQWPDRPTAHVELVQLTGRPLEDLLRIWRAAEAELEERRAYGLRLEAAVAACMEPAAP
jgi:hypothetical protein